MFLLYLQCVIILIIYNILLTSVIINFTIAHAYQNSHSTVAIIELIIYYYKSSTIIVIRIYVLVVNEVQNLQNNLIIYIYEHTMLYHIYGI